MKIPKWLVAVAISFSVIGPCTTVGWLWVRWPDKAAAGFVRAIAEGDFDAANANMPHDADVNIYWERGAEHEIELHTSFWDERKDGCWVFSSLSSFVYTRDFWDLVMGERTIVICSDDADDSRRIEVTVKRDRISDARIWYDFPFNMQ